MERILGSIKEGARVADPDEASGVRGQRGMLPA